MHSLNHQDLGRRVAAERVYAALNRRKAGSPKHAPPGHGRAANKAARAEHRPNSAAAARRAAA